MNLDPNFGIGILCANEGQDRSIRTLRHQLLRDGWMGFYIGEIEHRIIASNAGTIMLRVPGGTMEVGEELEFDCMTQCAKNPKTEHVGQPEALNEVLVEIGKLRRRRALYLGACRKWDKLSAQQIVYLTHKELDPYQGNLEEIYVDCGCKAMEGHAYPIVHRVCRDLGIECGAETRGLRGYYSNSMKHKHCCAGSKWDSSGGALGDNDHAAILPGMPPVWILAENEANNPAHIANVRRWKRQSGRVMVGLWSGLTATNFSSEIDP